MIDMPGLLQQEIEATSDGMKLTLQGELDIYSSAALEHTLLNIQADTDVLLLDLTALDFIDCAGLRTIVDAGIRARRKGKSLRVVRGPQRVHKVFVLTRLDQDLEFVDLAGCSIEPSAAPWTGGEPRYPMRAC